MPSLWARPRQAEALTSRARGARPGSVQDEVTLHVERAGSGPSLVLAHGFGGSARNFRKQARALGARYQLFSYDARGHARSGAPEQPSAYGISELVDDLSRVARRADAPVAIGGLSLGAYTALSYALRAEQKPRALVIASYPGPDTKPGRVRWAHAFADAIDQRGLDAAGAEFVWGDVSRFDENSAALIRQGFLEHAPHALSALLRNVLSHIPDPDTLGSELSRLTVPTLLLAGSDDPDAIDASERLARYLPQAQFDIIPGAGHLVNLQNAPVFNEALGAFLDRTQAV